MPDNTQHEPTDASRRHVEGMAAVGIPQDDIARIVGISAPTLRKHYRDELDLGATKANARVGQNLWRQATKDDFRATTAAIFWAKTRMGWKEPPTTLEHTGKDGGPIQSEDVTADAADFTSRLARLAAASGAGTASGDDPAGNEGGA